MSKFPTTTPNVDPTVSREQWYQYCYAVINWKAADMQTLVNDLSSAELAIVSAYVTAVVTSQLDEDQLSEFVGMMNAFRNMHSDFRRELIEAKTLDADTFAFITPKSDLDPTVRPEPELYLRVPQGSIQ